MHTMKLLVQGLLSHGILLHSVTCFWLADFIATRETKGKRQFKLSCENGLIERFRGRYSCLCVLDLHVSQQNPTSSTGCTGSWRCHHPKPWWRYYYFRLAIITLFISWDRCLSFYFASEFQNTQCLFISEVRILLEAQEDSKLEGTEKRPTTK